MQMDLLDHHRSEKTRQLFHSVVAVRSLDYQALVRGGFGDKCVCVRWCAGSLRQFRASNVAGGVTRVCAIRCPSVRGEWTEMGRAVYAQQKCCVRRCETHEAR